MDKGWTRFGLLTRVVVIAALGVLAAAGVVSAHGELESAEPEPDSTIPRAPDRVTARFSEELDPDGSRIVVIGPDEVFVDTGDGGVDLTDPDRTSMVARLQEGLGDGTYTVEWVTVSAEDGHTEQGNFTFTVDANAPEPTADPDATTSPEVIAPTGTAEPVPSDLVAENRGIDRGTVIIGALAILVAIAVVATIGRRRSWR